MKNKYYNDAIIGGKSITASYTKNGELLRLMYNMPDFRQLLDFFRTGVKINDSCMIYLHEDRNNRYNQYYSEDTNVLNTEILNTYFNLKIKQIDFVSLKESVLIKRYIFTNNNTIDLNINFLIHSKLLSNSNNMVGGKLENNVLFQYCHTNTLCMFSKNNINTHQLNDTDNNIGTGVIHDKDYIGMSSDSSINYEVGILKPGESKELDIYIYLLENTNKAEETIWKNIEDIRKLDAGHEQAIVEKYWKKFVKDHVNLELKDETNEYNRNFNKIYKRSILLFPLLTNKETGGVTAALEVDENLTQCGRYGYCWPRDAVFITRAFDKINMQKETEKFYKIFCKNTQNKNGMWEQRFYTDCRLAPCWGYQIDETAGVVYGVYEHYKNTKDKKFLKETLKMCENAIKFLCVYMNNILGIEENEDIVKNEIEKTYHTEKRNKLPLSYDLWEMCEDVHLYSLACIYSAFNAILEIYEIFKPEYMEKNRLKLESINKLTKKIEMYKQEIKKYIDKNMYNEKTNTLKRNTKDELSDISLLGAVVPFKLYDAKEKRIVNTIEKINMTLRTYTGGYLRFEGDHYREGKSPWVIATAWMGMYYKEIGENNKAQECLDFIVKSSNEYGFLGEQVDNNEMKPNWVIGLAWSHAMFILLATL